MARTRRADYTRSNRIRTLPLSDPEVAAWASQKLLNARDALSRRLLGSELLGILASQTGVPVPELVVEDRPAATWSPEDGPPMVAPATSEENEPGPPAALRQDRAMTSGTDWAHCPLAWLPERTRLPLTSAT